MPRTTLTGPNFGRKSRSNSRRDHRSMNNGITRRPNSPHHPPIPSTIPRKRESTHPGPAQERQSRNRNLSPIRAHVPVEAPRVGAVTNPTHAPHQFLVQSLRRLIPTRTQSGLTLGRRLPRSYGPPQELRRHPGRRRRLLHHPAPGDLRTPRPQRRRQDHHHPHALHRRVPGLRRDISSAATPSSGKATRSARSSAFVPRTWPSIPSSPQPTTSPSSARWPASAAAKPTSSHASIWSW